MNERVMVVHIAWKPSAEPFLTCLTSNGISKIFDNRSFFQEVYIKHNNSLDKLKKQYDRKLIDAKTYEKQKHRIEFIHKEKIKETVETIATNLIDYFYKKNLKKIVLGYSINKRNLKDGKFNCCYFFFYQKLMQYAHDLGIDIMIVDEVYCSQASFLDGDEIPVHEKNKKYKFSGKIDGNCYKTAQNIRLNQDINSCLNLLKRSDTVSKKNLNILKKKFSTWSVERL